MKNHWFKFLKVKQLAKRKPIELFVELGAGGGENTIQILELAKKRNFKVIVISDGDCPEPLRGRKNLEWRFGISYIELASFKNGSIDFCSIDTDHNYWTLKQELSQLKEKMGLGGIVVMHDTESYGHKGGMMQSYNCAVTYPYEEIKKTLDRGLLDAIQEVIDGGGFWLLRQTKESAGATAIMKVKP